MYAHVPARVELDDHGVAGGRRDLEDAVRGVVGCRLVGLAALVDALADVGLGLGVDGVDRAEEPLDDVVPVGVHVGGHATAVLLAVVPAGPLSRHVGALPDPVAELAAHREDAAEEALVDELTEPYEAGQVQLVVDDAVDDAELLRQAGELDGLLQRLRRRLLGEDVLARGDGRAERREAP